MSIILVVFIFCDMVFLILEVRRSVTNRDH